jgi:hypothetical protein
VRQDDGSYARVNPGRNILQLLEDLGQFNTLLAAIKVGAAAVGHAQISCEWVTHRWVLQR